MSTGIYIGRKNAGLSVLSLMLLLGCGAPFPAIAQHKAQQRQIVLPEPRAPEHRTPEHRAGTGVPLAEALRKFARESGYDAVFPEKLVEGKRAAPVRNASSAYDALAQMLAGSGLTPRFTRPDAFVLEAVAPGDTAPDIALDSIEVLTMPVGNDSGGYGWYGERVLEASLQVLRRSRELDLKTYDFTLYVWLSGEGRVVNLEGYGGTEHQEAIRLAKDLLFGLIVGTTPPHNMPQPVGLRIVSQ